MILATHAICGARGFWLPNDPRGSWSKFVASWELFRYGPATTVNTRRSVAHTRHDHSNRLAAKSAMLNPPVSLTGPQALLVSKGFAAAAEESNYSMLACAILPEHVHIVIARHSRDARTIVGHLKTRATQELRANNMFQSTTPWSRSCWTVYLDDDEDVRRAIRYVEDNPLKEGKRPQRWSFVTAYDPPLF